jgi:hypothetical protein
MVLVAELRTYRQANEQDTVLAAGVYFRMQQLLGAKGFIYAYCAWVYPYCYSCSLTGAKTKVT